MKYPKQHGICLTMPPRKRIGLPLNCPLPEQKNRRVDYTPISDYIAFLTTP